MENNGIELSKLSPPKGSRKRKIRLGRGESSGHGKTCGRGGKGQKGRKGATIRPGFEGGQMPLYRRTPKLGFFSHDKVRGFNQFDVINLSQLNSFDEGAALDLEAFKKRGLAKRYGQVKILGTGELQKKISVKVHAISASAKAKIEAKGGKVELVTCESCAVAK